MQITIPEKKSFTTYPDNIPYNLWLKILVENLPQGVLLVNAERRISICNKQLCKLFHIPDNPEEMIGKEPSEFLNQVLFVEDIKVIADRVQHIVDNKVAVYKDELKLTNGRVLWRDYIPFWMNSEFRGHMWIFYDKTENIHETQMQLSEKNYRDLFNYSLALICTHDIYGALLRANPALCNLLEFTEEELHGKNISQFIPEQDEANFEELYLQPLITDKKAEGVFRVICKSGKMVYLLYQNYLVEEQKHSPYVVCYAQDITDRIIVEKQLKKTKKITEETTRAKELFLANMSHEIRTPMNGILGITSLLEKTELNEKQKHYVNIINESAASLLNIINDIIDLEKIGAGKIQLEKIPFNIFKKIRSVLNLFEHSAESKTLKFNFNNNLDEHLEVIGDPTRLTQILNNLISNAIKFTHEGAVTVTTEVENETDDAVTVKIVVTDTGIGIEEEKLYNLFQPFTQATPETTRLYGGSGLGLSIIKNLIELQQGSIIVKSKLRKGSSFTVLLPYSKLTYKIESIKVNGLMNTEQFKGLRVLVADDNEINQLLACKMLEFWGVKTIVATNGLEVLEALSKNEVQLILMDIQMPGKNGIETTKEIRTLKDDCKKNIPIIALTANAMKGDDVKYFSAGMDGYLTKPFKEKELYNVMLSIIKKILPKKNLEPEMKLYDFTFLKNMQSADDQFINSLKEIFIKSIPPTSKQLVQACEQQQWTIAGELAHKLKSSIDTLNIQSLKEPIRHIETCAKQQTSVDTLKDEAINVNKIILRAVKQMQQDN